MLHVKKIMAILMSVSLLCAVGCGTFDNSGDSSLNDSSFSTGTSEALETFQTAKNVILMIGDGMGPEHVRAGELTKKEKLCMQTFPYSVKMSTMALNSAITDSAAAATAMATGTRTNTGLVGRDVNGLDLVTIVDWAKALGKRTGVITTEELYGATPMGFSGHSDSRLDYEELIQSAAKTSNVNLFASYTHPYTYTLTSEGYVEVPNVEDISESTEEKIFGVYNIKAQAPSMTAGQMVALDYLITEALEYLSADEDGFFLMAEGAHIDHGGHNNDFEYMVSELLAFDDAVKVVKEWASARDDTVVIVTADHETGGFHINETEEGDPYSAPLSYYFTSSYHTATPVNCYIYGADVDFSTYSLSSDELISNVDLFKIMKGLLMGTCLVHTANG